MYVVKKMVVANNIHEILGLSSKTGILSLPPFKESPLKIWFENVDGSEAVYDGQEPLLPFAQSEVFEASLSDWRCLTATNDECKPVYEVTFDVTGCTYSFNPGDTVGIIPRNRTNEIDTILEHLGLNNLVDCEYFLTMDKSMKGAKIPSHVPVRSTLRHVLTHCVDVRAVLKKLFILALSRYTKDENERKILEYLCSKEGSKTYITHVLEKNICLIDLFKIFKTCKPPIEILLTNLPRLLPRPYSIVNSRHRDPNKIKICFSVMDIGNNRKGLMTSWLQELILKEESLEDKVKNLNINNRETSRKVPIYWRKNVSEFLLPENMETPLLLIGPGTGVGPFIGFLEERQGTKDVRKMGQIWLYFGCRNQKWDFIYEKELNTFVANGTLNKLRTAFSRMDYDVKYVQDALLRDGAEIAKFIEGGAEIFICGDVKTLATQVRDTLMTCLVDYSGKSLQEADKFLNDMQKEKRYHVDSWS